MDEITEMLRIPLSEFIDRKTAHKAHASSQFTDTFYVGSNYKTAQSSNYSDVQQFRMANESLANNTRDKGFLLKHKRLKAMPHRSQQLPQIKFFSGLLTQTDEAEEREQSRQQSRFIRNGSRILTLEEELALKDDDDVELAARQVPPEHHQAPVAFHAVFKNIETIQEKKAFYMQSNRTLYAAVSQQISSTVLMPRKMGMLTVQKQEVNVDHFSMGDRYARVIGAGLASEPLKNIKSLNLKNNRLTVNGLATVTRSMPKKVSNLNLQGNKIGPVVRQDQASLSRIHSNLANIQELNLENNKFSDDGARALLRELAGSKTIRKLNLSRNCIGDNSAPELGNLLSNNKSIVEIYLHWNWLHGTAGRTIAQVLASNDSLKILDLSYNSLGVMKESQTRTTAASIAQLASRSQLGSCATYFLSFYVRAWSEYLRSEFCVLVHVDLSSNGFSVSDTHTIAQSLDYNHTIYGFHFRGNGDTRTTIDHRGFMICPEDTVHDKEVQANFIINDSSQAQKEYVPGILNHRRIDGANVLPPNQHQEENCWLCDGWSEVTFIWAPSALEIHTDPIFIHFSHERYVPIKMTLVDVNSPDKFGTSPMSRKARRVRNIWRVKRMIPSNRVVKFFYSAPIIKTSAYSRLYEKINWDDQERTKKVVFYTAEGDMIKFKRPKAANSLTTQASSILVDKQYSSPLCESVPRTKDLGGVLNYRLEDIEIEEEQQFLDEDFFRDCQRDTDEQFVKCFEFDWQRSSLTRILKTPQETHEVKEYLRSIYRDLVAAYRYFSAFSPCGDIWCISLNVFTDIFASTVIEQGRYGLKDLDIMFKQCTSRHNNQTRVQTQLALIRFQFMEVVVRFAIDKYYKNGQCESVLEALQQLYEKDGLAAKVEAVQDPQEWRDLMYWTTQCNRVANSNSQVLTQLYNLAVGYRQLNYFTTQKFATPSSFRELMLRAKLIDDQNVERNINLAFSQSVALSMDEVMSDRHMQMQFKEFVEALCRVAEKMNVPNIEGDSKQEQLAYRFSYLINELASRYSIVKEEEKQKRKSMLDQVKRDNMSTVRGSFVQKNANKLVYEADETPANIIQPRFTNITDFSSAVQQL